MKQKTLCGLNIIISSRSSSVSFLPCLAIVYLAIVYPVHYLKLLFTYL